MRAFVILLLTAGLTWAAGIDGKWRADSVLPRGTKVTEYLELKADGTRLTGWFVDGFGGRKEIHDGKLTGDRVTFWIPWDNTGKCTAEGSLRDTTLDLILVTKNSRRAISARRE
jgi:hypothetical protein